MSRKLIDRLQQEFGPVILRAGEPHGDATVEVARGRSGDGPAPPARA